MIFYILSHSLHPPSRDSKKYLKVSQALEAGIIWVNCTTDRPINAELALTIVYLFLK